MFTGKKKLIYWIVILKNAYMLQRKYFGTLGFILVVPQRVT